jgi:predicted nucleotidyltransferase
MSVLIDDKLEEIAAACQRYGIERLFVFGSALRDDFKPGESDIDLLVEFGPLGLPEKGKTIAPQLVSAAQSW